MCISPISILTFICLVVTFYILNLLDATTTFFVVSKCSYKSERNPLVRLLIKKYGAKKGLFYTKLIVLFLLPLIIWSYQEDALYTNIVLVILDIFYLFVVFHNYNICRKIMLDKKAM